MHGWLEAHTLEIICGLLAFVFALEICFLSVFNTLGPWWRTWIAPPVAGFTKSQRIGWLSWNGLCLALCLIPVLT